MVTGVMVEHYKCPLHRYTFKISDLRLFATGNSVGKVLNLFAGPTKLELKDEVRNDLNEEIDADFHMDAYDCVLQFTKPTFNTILLDPPYSFRKSMEMYGGRKASRFKMIKDHIPTILHRGGRVITFGYHSVSMGKGRGFSLSKVGLFSHGGAIHDTIATVELFTI